MDFFSPEEVARARAYHRPLYVAYAADVALSTGVTAFLAFGWLGDRLYSATSGPWWARTLLFTLLALGVLELVRLPLLFWRGFHREREWGFSTQTFAGWAADRVKGFAIAYVLTAVGLVLLLGSIRVFETWWPLVAAPGAALLTVVLSFAAPLVFEPLFNRFRPLEDRQLADDLRALAERAGVPVRDVLVSDASRRTRKHNAYVSGLGATRRVVLFDTMLAEASQPELEAVIAHELGHRRHHDVAKGTVLGTAAAAVAVLAVWPLDPAPRVIPLVLLVWGALELASLPFFAWLSRRMERRADRFALDVTGDRNGLRSAFESLARKNLSDVDPPSVAYFFLFTHPTPAERIAATVP